jgi:hypothetical protein
MLVLIDALRKERREPLKPGLLHRTGWNGSLDGQGMTAGWMDGWMDLIRG